MISELYQVRKSFLLLGSPWQQCQVLCEDGQAWGWLLGSLELLGERGDLSVLEISDLRSTQLRDLSRRERAISFHCAVWNTHTAWHC